jgi:hypothetical protein
MGNGNVASRISAVERDERGPLIRYQALQDLADKEQGTVLDLNHHRYKAVANRICVGFFSSLKLAFTKVDSTFPLWGTTWEQAAESESDLLNYVQDVVANRTFVRVAIQRKAQGA